MTYQYRLRVEHNEQAWHQVRFPKSTLKRDADRSIPDKVVHQMNHLKVGPLLFLSIFLAGCGNLGGFKILAPESFGLTRIAEHVYLESGADEKTIFELGVAISKAEQAIRSAYAGVESQPVIHACMTERCYESFGGMGSRAKVYGDHILLSPRGFNWHFLAHEWSHVELRTRLTFSAWWQLPSWFDEGLAVSISDAPEHSEEHWQYLVANNIKRPTHAELISYTSGKQWLDAVHHYGETKNAERRAMGEKEVAPLYAAAGHEVRLWLAKYGTRGLANLILNLNNGQYFDEAYQTANTEAR